MGSGIVLVEEALVWNYLRCTTGLVLVPDSLEVSTVPGAVWECVWIPVGGACSGGPGRWHGRVQLCLIAPRQWHQEQRTFSAEDSLWFWQTKFFSLGSLFFLQKPWVYDLWEVWNGYPRQVRTSDTIPHSFSPQAPDVVPWVRSEAFPYSLSTSAQSFASFCAGVDSILILYLSFVSFCTFVYS